MEFILVLIVVSFLAAPVVYVLGENTKILGDFTRWLEKKTTQIEKATKQMEEEDASVKLHSHYRQFKKNQNKKKPKELSSSGCIIMHGWDPK